MEQCLQILPSNPQNRIIVKEEREIKPGKGFIEGYLPG